ncbi:MAG: serine/threonine protein kinase [Myxococcales bacterium]|nr:serine/threonine protein kinase [Myxococcales bacterium]
MSAAETVPSSDKTPSSEDRAALPRNVGPYTLFELIGRGGMAEIYLARRETDLGATRRAVVKQILPAFADDPRFSEMLTHEAKLAARLSHQNIVQVDDLGRDGDALYIAMEYVEGFDLGALLRKCSESKRPLPLEYALGIVADVLHALEHAHRRTGDDGEPLGIVHRDVSPTNVLISFEGEVKLCDFGIANANALVRSDDANEALMGKAGYMSPEHARGDKIDARADVFATGIMLWELIAGRRLYKPKGELPLIEQARRAEIPKLPDKGLPQQARLYAIVKRALAPLLPERYPSAGAMLRDLEEYMASAGLLANRIKLGEWLEQSFGKELIESRRASERRLPKGAAVASKSDHPPSPTTDEPVAPEADGGASGGASTAASSASIREARHLPMSQGAIRAFKRELESSPSMPLELDVSVHMPGGEPPGSLDAATMELPPASDPHTAADASQPIVAPARPSRLPLVLVAAGLLVVIAIAALMGR